MSDRVCVRGCVIRGVHYATCESYGGPEEAVACRGCAPRECQEGSLICGSCFGRARRLLDDLPDLLGRLRSLADPSKATPFDKAPGGGQSTEPAAPVGSDLLDAIFACETVAAWWGFWQGNLPEMSNRVDAIHLFDQVLERHREDAKGIREAWSVQDAVDVWGVERKPGKNEKPWEDSEDDAELATSGVREWGDEQLVTKRDAWKLAGSERTFQRWVKDERITAAAVITIAGVRTTLFRAVEVVAMKKEVSNA